MAEVRRGMSENTNSHYSIITMETCLEKVSDCTSRLGDGVSWMQRRYGDRIKQAVVTYYNETDDLTKLMHLFTIFAAANLLGAAFVAANPGPLHPREIANCVLVWHAVANLASACLLLAVNVAPGFTNTLQTASFTLAVVNLVSLLANIHFDLNG